MNLRTDEYGGTLENRSRIIFEIVDEVRRRVPDSKFSIAVKLNSHDFIEGGFDGAECEELVKRLEERLVDWIELSGGTYESFPFEVRIVLSTPPFLVSRL